MSARKPDGVLQGHVKVDEKVPGQASNEGTGQQPLKEGPNDE
jgi:hypothetical protein